ncbi:MAG: hypothetical protein ACLQVD_08780 [Capsulimonadaceae bacterium]
MLKWKLSGVIAVLTLFAILSSVLFPAISGPVFPVRHGVIQDLTAGAVAAEATDLSGPLVAHGPSGRRHISRHASLPNR